VAGKNKAKYVPENQAKPLSLQENCANILFIKIIFALPCLALPCLALPWGEV
jgi:hypothetical protein